MADLLRDGEAAVRVAETLLRGTGGRAVLLRLPTAAAGGDEAEQMGLAVPGFNDVELAPCVFRKVGSRSVLLASAAAVQKIVGSLAFDSAAVLFKVAAGVVVDGIVLEIESMAPVESFGVAVCYRVGLKAAAF
ncbi:MAG TPA: hypothetical protein VFC39_09800 [Acidobacteriaceae bacterium]|nr:hypothetical protein [Acidobacteriaceae bacterium]